VHPTAVADTQPLGQISTGGTRLPHGHQFRPVLVKATFAIHLSPRLGPAGPNSLDFDVGIECRVVPAHGSVLQVLPREIAATPKGFAGSALCRPMLTQRGKTAANKGTAF